MNPTDPEPMEHGDPQRCLCQQRWQVHREHRLACPRCWEVAVRACLSKVTFPATVFDKAQTQKLRGLAGVRAYRCDLCGLTHFRTRSPRTPGRNARILRSLRPRYPLMRLNTGAIEQISRYLNLARRNLQGPGSL